MGGVISACFSAAAVEALCCGCGFGKRGTAPEVRAFLLLSLLASVASPIVVGAAVSRAVPLDFCFCCCLTFSTGFKGRDGGGRICLGAGVERLGVGFVVVVVVGSSFLAGFGRSFSVLPPPRCCFSCRYPPSLSRRACPV